MARTITLASHTAIRNWVQYRDGHPAMTNVRIQCGELSHKLALAFSGRALIPNNSHTPPQDIRPCSWDAWFAELDCQRLALKVIDSDEDDIGDSDVHFIKRAHIQ